MIRALAAAAVLLSLLPAAYAQTTTGIQKSVVVPSCGAQALAPNIASPTTEDTTGDACVNASVSVTASITGFAPNGSFAALSASVSSYNVALPTGTVVLIYNQSANTAYLNFGPSNAVAATTSDLPLPANATYAFTIGLNTYVAAITSTSTATLALTGGSGLFTGAGGGGSGGGGAITAASGAYASGALSAGAIVDLGTGASPASNTVNNNLNKINTTLGSPIQATGGTVGLVAGSAIIGKAGIDQTTAGTTNGVSIADIGSTAASGGAGPAGAGALRETVAQDTTTIAGSAPGTAGTPSANVLSVQGVTSMTPLKVDGSGVTQPVSGAFWQTTQPISGSVTANLGTLNGAALASNQTNVTGSATGGTAAADSQLAGGIYNSSAPSLSTGQQASFQLDSAGRVIVDVGAGGGSGGTSSSFGATFPSTGTAIGASQGGNMIAVAADSSHNLDVNCQVGCAAIAGISTLVRLVSSAASTNLTAVKSSSATLFKFGACNTTTSAAYVKFYNLASGSVTVGSSTVFLSRELPPDQCSSYDFANGYSFSTAISFAITGGNADSDTTALSSGEIVQAEAAYQ